MGDKPKRKIGRPRSTKNSTETFDEPLPDDSNTAEILGLNDEAKFEEAILNMDEAEKTALRIVWKKSKHAKLRSYSTTPHPSRLMPIRDVPDEEASPEMGAGPGQKKCDTVPEETFGDVFPPAAVAEIQTAKTCDDEKEDSIAQGAESSSLLQKRRMAALEKSNKRLGGMNLKADLETCNNRAISMEDLHRHLNPGAPDKNYFFNWNSYSAELRRQYTVGGAPFKPDIIMTEIQNCVKSMDSNSNMCRAVMMLSHLVHHTASELSLVTKCNEQLELLLADFTSGVKEDCDGVYARLEAIEGDITMLIDDTIKIDDKLGENASTCSTKRDALLANITEIRDKIAAIENRPATFAAVTSGGSKQSTGSKRKTGTEPAAMPAKRSKQGVPTTELNAPQDAQMRLGTVPKEFRGRDGKLDLLVTLTDPLDILGYMFPLNIMSGGKKFPCIALAIMMAEAKATGSVDLENSVYACTAFFVKHNGINFDRKYNDFVGRLNAAWSQIWQEHLAQGSSVVGPKWFNCGNGPFEHLYGSIEEAKNSVAYLTLKKILKNAVKNNPQFRQLLFQTGRERNGNIVTDNPRFIRCTGSFPNSGFKGALLCGADRLASEAALGTMVGPHYMAPYMNLWGECLMETRAAISQEYAYRMRDTKGSWVTAPEYGIFDEYDRKGHWKLNDPTNSVRSVFNMLRDPNKSRRARGGGPSYPPRGGGMAGRGAALSNAQPNQSFFPAQNDNYRGRGQARGASFGRNNYRGRVSVSATPVSAFLKARVETSEPAIDSDDGNEPEPGSSTAQPVVSNELSEVAALKKRVNQLLKHIGDVNPEQNEKVGAGVEADGDAVQEGQQHVPPPCMIDDGDSDGEYIEPLVTPALNQVEDLNEGTIFEENDSDFESPTAPHTTTTTNTVGAAQASAAPVTFTIGVSENSDKQALPNSQANVNAANQQNRARSKGERSLLIQGFFVNIFLASVGASFWLAPYIASAAGNLTTFIIGGIMVLNSCANPIIYLIFNKMLKGQIGAIFGCQVAYGGTTVAPANTIGRSGTVPLQPATVRGLAPVN